MRNWKKDFSGTSGIFLLTKSLDILVIENT